MSDFDPIFRIFRALADLPPRPEGRHPARRAASLPPLPLQAKSRIPVDRPLPHIADHVLGAFLAHGGALYMMRRRAIMYT